MMLKALPLGSWAQKMRYLALAITLPLGLLLNMGLSHAQN